MAKKKKPSDHDLMVGYLKDLPQIKKEAFLLLVRTKTRKDLKSMKLTATKEDSGDAVKLLDAAITLRVFIEAGIPLTI